MRAVDLDYIVASTGGELFAKADGDYGEIKSVSIDSRTLGEKCIFFCTIGKKVDAHKFLPDIREKGCHNVVVSDLDWAEKMRACRDMNVILVSDTVKALMAFATKYMDDWKDLPRVAITGSVGKTSTKEFTYAVLSSKYKCGKTPGNLNSEFGIPLTCFSYPEDIEMAICEIGVGGGPDMRELVDIIKPDAAIVTNVGSSHLDYFDNSRTKLQEAKLRITTGFKGDGLLVVNSDCQYLTPDEVVQHSEGEFELVTVGTSENAMYRLSEIHDRGIDGVKCTLDIEGRGRFELSIPVIGAHNLFNSAEAVAIGDAFGIEPEDAISALSNVVLAGNRLDIRRGERFVVVNDTYNASPESMKAGIDVISASEGRRRGAILGDMFELGENSAELHASVGEYAVSKGLDFLVTIGEGAKAIAQGAQGAMSIAQASESTAQGAESQSGELRSDMLIISFDSKKEALEQIFDILEDGDVVLVKASRGMALEDISEAISV